MFSLADYSGQCAERLLPLLLLYSQRTMYVHVVCSIDGHNKVSKLREI